MYEFRMVFKLMLLLKEARNWPLESWTHTKINQFQRCWCFCIGFIFADRQRSTSRKGIFESIRKEQRKIGPFENEQRVWRDMINLSYHKQRTITRWANIKCGTDFNDTQTFEVAWSGEKEKEKISMKHLIQKYIVCFVWRVEFLWKKKNRKNNQTNKTINITYNEI